MGRKTLWAWAAGTFFGAGLLRPGPGTWGSVAALLLWMLLASARSLWQIPVSAGSGAGVQVVYNALPLFTLLLALLAALVGIPAATRVALESGREDPGHVVIDEVAGQWLTLAICRPDWPHALLALLLFRLFDITKPWPVRKLEDLPGGLGIMLDDLGAGVYGMVVLALIQYWW